MSDQFGECSEEAGRFIRVEYDDSREEPWLVIFGEDLEWGSFREKEKADFEVEDMRDLVDMFYEWRLTVGRGG